MDPVTLAAGAIALLTAFFAKAGEAFAGEGGKAAWQLAGRLFDRFRLAVKNKPGDRQVLEDFSSNPADSAPIAEGMVTELLAQDSALAADVQAILQAVKDLGPTVVVSQRVRIAEDVVGIEARRIRSGSIEVNQQIEEGRNITGLRIEDEIGLCGHPAFICPLPRIRAGSR
jgi:hypothetical protein